jgi:hypothetical protein
MSRVNLAARRQVVEMEFDRSGGRIRVPAGKCLKLTHESTIET